MIPRMFTIIFTLLGLFLSLVLCCHQSLIIRSTEKYFKEVKGIKPLWSYGETWSRLPNSWGQSESDAEFLSHVKSLEKALKCFNHYITQLELLSDEQLWG